MLLLDLFVVALGAVAAGWICRRLNVPEVLGYLAAGMLLGQGLHAFTDEVTIETIGTFAVVFRMFTLGLDFDGRRLRGRWRPALTAGLLEMGVCSLAGVALALLMGWSPLEGAVLGAAMGTTSTSILSKALADRNLSTREDARAAGSATLTEDLIVMGMLALLTVFGGAKDGASIWQSAAELVVFASLAFTAGAMLVPLGLDRLARSRSDEILTLAVVGVLFGFAALSFAIVRGFAVGAFLAGIAVGAARNAPGVSTRVTPLRDLLVPVAYVSLGLQLDVATVIHVAPLAAGVALVFVVLKLVAITVGLRLGGVPTTTAARAGAILGQVGTMGLVYACKPFLGPAFQTLIAIAFVSWAFTVALTGLRIQYLPEAMEAIARALGAKDHTSRSARIHGTSDARVRADAYVAVLCVGGAVALAALMGLSARGGASMLPAIVVLPLEAAAGAIVGPLLFAFALVAASAAGSAAHQSARNSATRARRMAHGGRDPSRVAAMLATLVALVLAIATPIVMVLVLAPSASWLPILIGAALCTVVVLAREAWWTSLVAGCERLARARMTDAPDPRLHDFRGVSPFGFDVEGLLVRAGTRAAWATLRDLAVPEHSGARVIAIVRPGTKDGISVGPDTRVHPGDEIVLGGSTQQVVQARRYLLEPSMALEDDAPTHDGQVHGGVPKSGPRVA